MRRIFVLGVIATLGSVLFIAPGATGQELGPPPEADSGGSDVGGFHGFSNFQTHAQAHVGSLVGYLSQFREENRLAGALSEINGPPANSRNIAGLYQRGEAAKFVYGVIGGGGGERGTLPDPPPGEVGAYYPTDPPEDTWQGPITAANRFQAVDGTAHAKATEIPTGEADAAFVRIDVPEYFLAEFAAARSQTKPIPGGVEAEAVSVLQGLTAGPLRIETLTSRAYAYMSTVAEDPVGRAATVIEGATVNDIPVQITDKGVLVGENASPGAQEQVNAAMKGAGFKEVLLTPATAAAGEDKQSVTTSTGFLSFVHYDEKFGASNPQGFSGGGFTVGGAEASVAAKRCEPECPSASSGTGDIPDIGDVGDGVPAGKDQGTDQEPRPASASYEPPSNITPSAAPTALPDFGVTAGLPTAVPFDSGFGAYSSPGSSSTSAFTPGAPADFSGAIEESAAAVDATGNRGTSSSGASEPAVSPEMLPVLALDSESANWMRDLYLAMATAAMVIVIAQRVVRAR